VVQVRVKVPPNQLIDLEESLGVVDGKIKHVSKEGCFCESGLEANDSNACLVHLSSERIRVREDGMLA